jgi:hypothetical protein
VKIEDHMTLQEELLLLLLERTVQGDYTFRRTT